MDGERLYLSSINDRIGFFAPLPVWVQTAEEFLELGFLSWPQGQSCSCHWSFLWNWKSNLNVNLLFHFSNLSGMSLGWIATCFRRLHISMRGMEPSFL